jgi:DNA polymerase I-like protein with 3'-5' exonuclease and polymerase domains
MPRIFKPCVKARNEGWYVCEADGAQLEFRVAAFLGQDQQAIYDIENGTDIHQYTADTITGAGQETSRQEAKAHTFKPLFGGRSGTKAEKSYYEAFKEKYCGVARQQEMWKAEAIRNKKFRIPSGLEFFFPNIRASRSKDGYIPEEANIFNYPIQSFATADIIPIAIVYLWHGMKINNLESFIFNTVHDSVIVELNPKEKDIFNTLALEAFGKRCYDYLKDVYDVEFNVPLGCGIKIGSNWGTGEEIAYDLPSPYKFNA